MTQEVTGCENCPMMASHWDGWGSAHCNHPETEGNDLDTFVKNKVPEWCPLKKEPITIKFIEKKEFKGHKNEDDNK